MTPADKLLDHFDRIAGSEPNFLRISDEGVRPILNVAIYRGFPERDALTGFTVGLSHLHPPGGAHKELTISMRDADDVWALACGFVALQFREECPFGCGTCINFREQIAPSSTMSAFLVEHPRYISPQDTIVDLGFRKIEIMQLVPLYPQEYAWLKEGGEPRMLLDANPGWSLMEPRRQPFVPT
ncbi:MAG TPA: suppressor of fused domain protein [Pirellulaceae bacterium]|nr:suppressor of fused domain protein [Pirellulaceae bacterium]